MPTGENYIPDPRHPALGDALYDPVAPADFPQSRIRFRNDRWAARIGLDTLTDAEWVAHLARFEPLPGNIPQPLALRYHGHQFRAYNPDLGDGRGFLHAQVRDAVDGRLLDLATKGSGQTPWSRSGDGRLTLKGGVREVLATEMLEAQGVYTSKTLSLVETGEKLWRNDEPSPTRSAVLVRLGHGHVRIGSFQRLAYLGDAVNLRRLTDYAIETYWPQAASDEDPVAGFFECVVRAVAEQAAEWYPAGFVHGVLNTDNTMITGESFDYGPWRWLPHLDVMFTAAYFDQSGLYAFGRQPGALHWNLQRLADCLVGLSTEARLVAALEAFAPAFEARLAQMTLGRLGLTADGHDGPADDARTAQLATDVIRPFYVALHDSKLPFERVFFDLVGGALPERLAASPHAPAYATEPWTPIIATLRTLQPSARLEAALAHPYFSRAAPVTMLIDEVEALWSGITDGDDWSGFEAKVAAVREMGEAYRPVLPPRRGHSPIARG